MSFFQLSDGIPEQLIGAGMSLRVVSWWPGGWIATPFRGVLTHDIQSWFNNFQIEKREASSDCRSALFSIWLCRNIAGWWF